MEFSNFALSETVFVIHLVFCMHVPEKPKTCCFDFGLDYDEIFKTQNSIHIWLIKLYGAKIICLMFAL